MVQQILLDTLWQSVGDAVWVFEHGVRDSLRAHDLARSVRLVQGGFTERLPCCSGVSELIPASGSHKRSGNWTAGQGDRGRAPVGNAAARNLLENAGLWPRGQLSTDGRLGGFRLNLIKGDAGWMEAN